MGNDILPMHKPEVRQNQMKFPKVKNLAECDMNDPVEREEALNQYSLGVHLYNERMDLIREKLRRCTRSEGLNYHRKCRSLAVTYLQYYSAYNGRDLDHLKA